MMQPTGREPFGIEVEVAAHVVGQADRIRFVVDRERGSIAEPGRVSPEDPRARAVKCRDPHLVGERPNQVSDPRLHLAGGLVRERDREEFERRDTAIDEVRDSVGQEAGLARTGAGDNEHGTIRRTHRITLDRIQPFEKLRRAHAAHRTDVRFAWRTDAQPLPAPGWATPISRPSRRTLPT